MWVLLKPAAGNDTGEPGRGGLAPRAREQSCGLVAARPLPLSPLSQSCRAAACRRPPLLRHMPTLGAAQSPPRYQPRSSTNDLKDLVEEQLEELLRVWNDQFASSYGPLHPRVRELLERFVRCGDLHFGFLRLRCVNPDCPKKGELWLPYSCKVRGLCPSCGQRRAIEWAERMVEEVLPVVPYRQLVFTIPRRLRKYFLFERSLYGELCRAAYASTRDFLRAKAPAGFVRLKKAVPAMVVVPQSFGDLLVPHAHCHAVVSLGLFSPEGFFHRMEEVDFSGLEELFRERVFEMMIRRGKITAEVAEDMRRWPHSGFHLNWERRIDAEERKELEGLLSYMERAPVSLRRLTYRGDGMVHYQGTKYHPRLGTDHQLLPAVEFLALLVPHVLLRYEVTLRSYGAASTTFRRKAGWMSEPPVKAPPPELFPAAVIPGVQPPPRVPDGPPSSPTLLDTTLESEEAQDDESLRARKRTWAKLIAKTWLEDPELCRTCGQPMKIIALISSPQQDDLIEKLLRHLNRWDPPWKRQRKARAPPPSKSPRPSSTALGAELIDPPIEVDHYFSDPPSGDDWPT